MANTSAVTEKTIFERGVLIAVRSGYYEGRKRMSREQLKGLPEDIVRGVHDIFDKEFKKLIKDIGHFNRETRGIVKRAAVPFPVDGIYFLRAEKIASVVELIESRDAERKDLVEKATANYEDAITVFQEKYPKYYEHAKDKYISKADFASRFYFRYQLIQLGAPDKALIGTEQYKKEVEKFKETIEEMKREVVATIYEHLLDMTNRLKKQCGGDGKPNQRTFNNLGKFLDRIDDAYGEFLDRKDIKDVVKKIKAQILGVTADSLRDGEDAKKEFGKAIKELVSEIKALPDIPRKRALDI